MENPFTYIEIQLSNINAKLDKVLAENNSEPDSELLTLKEYAKLIKKSLPTIWRYEKDGKIKPVIIAGKKYYKKVK
ncbi:hypothetical protein SAMN05880574_11639 [Chryseobacterium sp. RU37D]|uniref:hypothetical protein n=1 Tax=Chryseobacterium sp. RU37D TaxID=1907397 RepID=UPI0009563A3A|nr:hypothetical protein [Chryseobacterium sp. RU37D]SIQ55642.1 hypothetical protein SAMN05880574_11639 [Chryseobacterium sp. RU37D]